jgi:hypothetical protein
MSTPVVVCAGTLAPPAGVAVAGCTEYHQLGGTIWTLSGTTWSAASPVQSVAGRAGAVTIGAGDVSGLGVLATTAVTPNPDGSIQVDGTAPTAGNFPGCVVPTTPTVCIPAVVSGSMRRHVLMQNVTPPSAPMLIACRWGGTPSFYNASSFLLIGMMGMNYGGATGWIGTQALTCMALATGGTGAPGDTTTVGTTAQLYIETD